MRQAAEQGAGRSRGAEGAPSTNTNSAKEVKWSEDEFYGFYEWCLSPVLSFEALCVRLREEMNRFEQAGVEWQRDECRINLYLFVCAIGCTTDDFLVRPWLRLDGIAARFPRWRFLVQFAQRLLNAIHTLVAMVRDHPLRAWRRRWETTVAWACEMLVHRWEAGGPEWSRFRDATEALLHVRMPPQLLAQRITVLEGFRSQDLSHHDVITMAQRFLGIYPQQERPLVVVGPRTAGAYFAPLVKAYLESHGWHDVPWVSIRPKAGVSLWETRRMRRLLEPSPRVLVVDDHPNTGTTFGLVLRWLCHLGVAPEDIVFLAPSHPKRMGWHLPAGTPGAKDVTVIRLEPSAFHKARLLAKEPAQWFLKCLGLRLDGASAVVSPSPQADAVNRRFAEQATDGFHVRLKHLYHLRAGAVGAPPQDAWVLAKSVGWGWLGYHAYLVGKRLEGSVAPVIALREGLVISRWVGTPEGFGQCPPSEMIRQAVPGYVARRAKALPLAEDPCSDDMAFDSSAWSSLADAFEGVYGRVLRRLKRRALREAMRKYLAPRPTVIDGALRPEEWVQTPKGLCKVDFEHHAFGSTEANVVDPAYDLASAIFELGLSAEEEQELLLIYTHETGDTTVEDRLCLHKIAYGLRALRRARYEIVHEPGSARNPFWNGRFTLARDFLIYHMGRLCASGMGRPRPTQWTERLFFLDLDGVFDRDVLGFPHTTARGVEAISLLLGHGVSVVLNTARSAEHVRRYCETYGLHGGVAEHGSVFVDQVCRREIPLVDGEASEQLALCRQAIQGLPNVFVDPDYEHVVRAYRYGQRGTVGLAEQEVRAFLDQRRFDRLTFLLSAEEAYIVSANVCKGTGLRTVKRLHGASGVPVAAIGDTSDDIPMLLAADFGYAPSNCSSKVRALVADGKCRVMRRPYQAGLLLAVRDALRRWGVDVCPPCASSVGPTGRNALIWALVRAADRSRLQQLQAVARLRSL